MKEEHIDDPVAVKYNKCFGLIVMAGVILRLTVMLFGHNFDFESYCIVGRLVTQFKNVYANTERYNYGPLFFCVQGILYALSAPEINVFSVQTYRVLIVVFLTTVDVFIAVILQKKYGIKASGLFLLNPISVIITGFHNQFDNLAILFAIIAFQNYNSNEKFCKKDVMYVLMFALSLITKHIMFMMPFWILIAKDLTFRKKIIYSFVPVILFLLSFVPFALESKDAFYGILQNVFLYRSFSNSPFLMPIYKAFGVHDNVYFVVFFILLALVGILVREFKKEEKLMIYLVALVMLSSAIANQYLVIPIVTLAVMGNRVGYLSYTVVTMLYLLFSIDGFKLGKYIDTNYPDLTFLSNAVNNYGLTVLMWILFFVLIYILLFKGKRKDPTEKEV